MVTPKGSTGSTLTSQSHGKGKGTQAKQAGPHDTHAPQSAYSVLGIGASKGAPQEEAPCKQVAVLSPVGGARTAARAPRHLGKRGQRSCATRRQQERSTHPTEDQQLAIAGARLLARTQMYATRNIQHAARTACDHPTSHSRRPAVQWAGTSHTRTLSLSGTLLQQAARNSD